MTTENQVISKEENTLSNDDLIFIIGEKEIKNIMSGKQLTTDDLIYVIGKKEVDALQSRKYIFELKNQLEINQNEQLNTVNSQIEELTTSNTDLQSELKNKDNVITTLKQKIYNLRNQVENNSVIDGSNFNDI